MSGAKITEGQIRRIAQQCLGGVGPAFIEKQYQRLGIDPSSITTEELRELAAEAKRNSVLLVGKTRAERLYTILMTYAKE